MQDSRSASGDWRASLSMLEKSAVNGEHLGSCAWQSSVEALDAKPSAVQSSGSLSAGSCLDFNESTEVENTTRLGYGPRLVNNASSPPLGHRDLFCDTTHRHLSRNWRPQSSFATHTSANDSSSTTDVIRADLSSDYLRSEADGMGAAIEHGGISQMRGLPAFTTEQVIHMNSVELGHLAYSENNANTEVGASSSQVAYSTATSESLQGPHVEAFDVHSELINTSTSVSRGECSGREARRNHGRGLWEALTSVSSRRRRFFPSPVVASEADAPRNLNGGWHIFDSNNVEDNDDLPHEIHSLSSTGSNMRGRAWRTRPQLWGLQQLNDSIEEGSRQSRHCAFGRHPNGHCSCEAFVTEESSTRASISRIVMLAEALFEVLDEIHRQSASLSGSTVLSVAASPAPEAVVESFAIRVHKKSSTFNSSVDQYAECYICLAEYEDGDHIRVLPCCHGFHRSCVDKWLKESHRVCPLCRYNVCEYTTGL
ncbi:hypothetical protein KP509_12G024800 [Ceratopteris richardii]|nr:hypothetical protein KP509_12G024800 [Ceratopteris richardii]